MADQLRMRFREWITFGVLLVLLFGVLTLIPLPQEGQSEVMREQMYLLPVVTQPLDIATLEPDQPVEITEPTAPAEEVLSNEQVTALLAEAFGVQEESHAPNEQLEAASRSPRNLEVEEFDIGFLESEEDRNQRVSRQNANLQSNVSSRRVPSLIQPGAETGGSPRALDNATGAYGSNELVLRAGTRPPPVKAEDFQEVSFDDSLAAWIRSNPADLDPVIRSVMGTDKDVATARAIGRTADSSYELQFLLARTNGEVRIVLIEGTDLYFFVRPRVRRATSYFQMGTARRNAANVVIAVESEDFSPESDEAQAFYGLFLDWWSTQRK